MSAEPNETGHERLRNSGTKSKVEVGSVWTFKRNHKTAVGEAQYIKIPYPIEFH
jgi:hypothetical protein